MNEIEISKQRSVIAQRHHFAGITGLALIFHKRKGNL